MPLLGLEGIQISVMMCDMGGETKKCDVTSIENFWNVTKRNNLVKHRLQAFSLPKCLKPVRIAAQWQREICLRPLQNLNFLPQ